MAAPDELISALRQADEQLLRMLGQRIDLLKNLRQAAWREAEASQKTSEGSGKNELAASAAEVPGPADGSAAAESPSEGLVDLAPGIHAELARTFAKTYGLQPEVIRHWLTHVRSVCHSAAGDTDAIAYLGPIYSYSYLAAVKHFGLAANLVPVVTIAAAFEEVTRGQSQFAVVPIENSTDGRVVDTLGMFARSPAQICGEVMLPIHHCLLGLCSRREIVEVQSKPQALSQCRRWLTEHLPNARLVEVSSTAAAAAEAALKPGVAAIASLEAGIHHQLQIIDENIEDNSQNVTRFVIIGNRQSPPSQNDKTSLMFQLEHRPGALASAMVIFQQANVNLTWIESFPLPGRPNEYLFFVELDGHRAQPHVQAAIDRLSMEARRLDVLGSYPRAMIA